MKTKTKNEFINSLSKNQRIILWNASNGLMFTRDQSWALGLFDGVEYFFEYNIVINHSITQSEVDELLVKLRQTKLFELFPIGEAFENDELI